MPFFIKSILALVFLLVGLIGVICMLTLMGRTERKISATLLRRLHKGAGLVFTILFIVISYFCIKYVATVGDQLSLRAVFHGVLAIGLFIVLVIKILIVLFYKQFMRYVPGLGLTVFALAFVVVCTSAGYFFLKNADFKARAEQIREAPQAEPEKEISKRVVSIKGDPEKGSALFESKCSFCHYSDREDSKMGPGLKGILKRETLPISGRPANVESIKQQLMTPVSSMPPFTSLTEQELADLLAYLEIL